LKAEEEKSRLEGKIEEVRKERDTVQQECEELKVQLHLTEDRLDANQNQLQETTHKLKEGILWCIIFLKSRYASGQELPCFHGTKAS
jgi:uncharacterized protein involved in exopolysaccharide biosynthesis